MAAIDYALSWLSGLPEKRQWLKQLWLQTEIFKLNSIVYWHFVVERKPCIFFHHCYQMCFHSSIFPALTLVSVHQHIFSQTCFAEAPLLYRKSVESRKSLRCILDLGIKPFNNVDAWILNYYYFKWWRCIFIRILLQHNQMKVGMGLYCTVISWERRC